MTLNAKISQYDPLCLMSYLFILLEFKPNRVCHRIGMHGCRPFFIMVGMTVLAILCGAKIFYFECGLVRAISVG
jgi:hypothetical protein